jgi:uncharacterized protein YeaO (DUF488 family)
MIRTSYFAKSGRDPGAVSIARYPPKGYTGARCLLLAPPPELLKTGDWDEYRNRYRNEVLSPLDPDEVLRALETLCPGRDIVLLCFERDRARCHRGLVAAWFQEEKGIVVPEIGEASGRQATL